MSLSCPLCSIHLASSTLEAHLRQELAYPALQCLLCRINFNSKDRAVEHFEGPLAEHPGQSLQLAYLEKEPVKEQRLVELVRLAEGGLREVEKRLCVCGQCRLMCREMGNNPDLVLRATRSEILDQGPNCLSHRKVQHHVNTPTQALLQDEELPKEVVEPKKSEEELQPFPEKQQIQMDIKPDLAELKPKINADGKVACIQCGMRIEKAWFKQHAIGAHSTARPFSCNLCPHNEKTKGILAKHQLKEHGAELSDDTFTFAGSEDKVREIVEQCFGSAKDTDWARLRCQPCDKIINKKHLKDHAAIHHLKKVLHSCKFCQYTSKMPSAWEMNVHLKKVHKRQPGPDTIDSSQAQHYAPIIKNMIPQLFSQ